MCCHPFVQQISIYDNYGNKKWAAKIFKIIQNTYQMLHKPQNAKGTGMNIETDIQWDIMCDPYKFIYRGTKIIKIKEQ